MRRWLGSSTGPEFPLTLGRDFSGVVRQTGHGVTRFKPGDEVRLWLSLCSLFSGGYDEKPASLGLINILHAPTRTS